jgi:transposase
MNIKRVGIELAKQVLQVHGVDNQEKVVLRKQLRNHWITLRIYCLPCFIGLEARKQ